MSAGKTVRRQITRPGPALVEAFRGISTANVDDCMERTAAVGPRLYPIGKAALLGTAFTVRVPQGDNLMVHKAMDLAQPGDVLVIDAGGCMNRSILGGLMTTYCRVRGLAGIIVDGCIRDRDELAKMDFPVYACGASPNGPYKNGPGELNVPVRIGEQVVCPGDILLGDADGLIVIHPEDAAWLAAAANGILKKEAAILEGILQQHQYPRPWVDEKLLELGYEIQ